MLTHTSRPRLTAGVLACLAVAGLPGCKQEAASTPARPIPEVQVITVATQTVPDDPEFIGQAESSRPVEIRSQVTGIIKERYFQEGRDVKKGARLYQIDPVPFQAALVSAKARVAQAEARLVQAEQNLARVKPLLAEQAGGRTEVVIAYAGALHHIGSDYERRVAVQAVLDSAPVDTADFAHLFGDEAQNVVTDRRSVWSEFSTALQASPGGGSASERRSGLPR